MIAANGKLVGFNKHVLVVACYIPPGYTAGRAAGCLDFIRDTVTELKRRYVDPYIIVAGDFNQWKIGEAL